MTETSETLFLYGRDFLEGLRDPIFQTPDAQDLQGVLLFYTTEYNTGGNRGDIVIALKRYELTDWGDQDIEKPLDCLYHVVNLNPDVLAGELQETAFLLEPLSMYHIWHAEDSPDDTFVGATSFWRLELRGVRKKKQHKYAIIQS